MISFHPLPGHSNNRFGLLSIINATKIGPIEMNTGKSNPYMIGQLISIMDGLLDGVNILNYILTGTKCFKPGPSGPLAPFLGHGMNNDKLIKIWTPCKPLEFVNTGTKLVKGSPQWGYHWIPSYKVTTLVFWYIYARLNLHAVSEMLVSVQRAIQCAC